MSRLTQVQRHHLLQKLFWNGPGSRVVDRLVRYERLFNVVVRNYSLIGETNGERWLETLLDESPLVFDVGFHDGASTREVLASRPKAMVIGFDPSRFAGDSHRAGFGADDRVTFENVGLSNAPGTVKFYDYANMCNSLAPRKEEMESPVVYEVPVTTVDAYCQQKRIDHITFMKIDAEGFDLHVLEGAEATLTEQRVDIFAFEFASGWSASKRYLWEVRDYFEGLPYQLFHLFNGFLCPFVYDIWIDSSCTLSAMYVGVSNRRLERGDIPQRDYRF